MAEPKLALATFPALADYRIVGIEAALTPALAIYGPTDYRRTSPLRYDGRHRIVRKPVECGPCFRMEGDATVRACPHHKCLGLITAPEVVQAAEEMLGLSAPVRALPIVEEEVTPFGD